MDLLFSSGHCCSIVSAPQSSSITATASHDKNAKYKESSPLSGIISTVAGYKKTREGSEEDGVPATSKKLFDPEGLTVDKEGSFSSPPPVTIKYGRSPQVAVS